MLITFLLALIFFSALLFLGFGFLSWVGAAGIWLIGWRLTGIQSPLLFETCVIALVVLALIFGTAADPPTADLALRDEDHGAGTAAARRNRTHRARSGNGVVGR